MKDLTISMENRPGTLADVGEALGKAGINIEGGCGMPCEGKGIGHLLVENAGAARSAIIEAGIEVLNERDVLVLDIENKQGTLGKVCRRISNAGVNIDLLYIAAGTRIVLGVDDLQKARAAAG
jgi:hypothetical protein